MSEDKSNDAPLNGGKTPTTGERIKAAMEAFHQAYSRTCVVPGPDGLRVQFDPLDLLVQGALDRITFQTLVELLVEVGDIDKAEFDEQLAKSIEKQTVRLTKGAGPRLVVPR